jgi:small subunit ribosomal protein S5e
MMNGRNNGKKLMAVRIVQHAFEIVHLVTEQNPIQVLGESSSWIETRISADHSVDAIVNTGPREDSTRIGSQGTVRRQAVDVSPLRRVNQAVSLLTIGVSPSRLIPITKLIYRPVNPLSTTPSRSPSASPTSSSTPPRDRPTRTPSRRRMSSSVSPSPTDNFRSWVFMGSDWGVFC